MREKILIACTMQMDAIRYVIKKYQIEIKVIWLNRRLHNNPEKLHACIQEKINMHQDAEEIILSYGLCGNAVIGLCSKNTKLIMPVFDDCICQMLYVEREGEIVNHGIPEKGCYYLTREWTIDQESIVSQCSKIYKQYGEEYGGQIIREIYTGYHSLVVIETGAYNVEKISRYVDKAANDTGMCVKTQEGSCKVIEDLLLGNYNGMIHVFHKGEKITRHLLKKGW